MDRGKTGSGSNRGSGGGDRASSFGFSASDTIHAVFRLVISSAGTFAANMTDG